ncbi:hypothetical protein Vadar_034131 [Vaccinium darrowii]|uniref:Uncharacterized protein n=1 Tax=Vaccinium darrowii TaxID=229202 RepID=A0ACB7Z0W4_9ERIC|nr:hypothetical protein Vadar_034131 [Vaccinium darrowii]
MSNLSKRILRGDFDGDSSDEDEVAMMQMVMASSYQQMQMRHNQQQGGYVGSVSGQSFIRRDRAAANERIHSDYFSEDPLFNEKIFRQRFRMAKPLFERILTQLQQHDDYFVQKPDAVGAAGLSEDVEAAELLRERPLQVSRERTSTFTDFLTRNKKIRSSETYHALRNDLVEHLWARRGEEA